MWKIDKRPQFVRQYKLGNERQQRVDAALRNLATSTNPAELGIYKANLRVFSYELGKDDRIIFAVDYTQNLIVLLRVCDHKSVYGKD